uniref:Uncharacterized protein n=1 Tax=Lepeophtheirus salmonis TaxID=72036 RepID=A0A0K2V8G7_LEPSM
MKVNERSHYVKEIVSSSFMKYNGRKGLGVDPWTED